MSEELILTNLITNDKYARKVLPFIRTSYFQDEADKVIFKSYVKYFQEYNSVPTRDALKHEITELDGLDEETFEFAINRIDEYKQTEEPDFKWLVDKTEIFCQEKSLYNSIMACIGIIDGTDKKLTKHAMPDLLKEALAVSFDTNIGHDYFEDAEERFEFYNMEHARIPFDWDIFNLITNGGVPNKTLNIILAGTNVGKTLGMIAIASSYLMRGKNVLYITMEMSEEAISNRIDANLMDIDINDVDKLEHAKFSSNIGKLRSKTNGKLIVKEYPTSSAHVGHFRVLLQELAMKKNFKPDAIFVDYIGIMASSRVSMATTSSYFYIKAIAEELRALGVEHDVPVWSAVQSNRSGQNDSDVDMTNTAESFGLPATADFMIAFIRTEELDALNQLLVKQLKSRYGNKNYYEKFVIGVDAGRNQLYDVEYSAQADIIQGDGDLGEDDEDDLRSGYRKPNSTKKVDGLII